MSELLTKARSACPRVYVDEMSNSPDRLCHARVPFSLPQTFRNRLVEVIDQAQHFAALGPALSGAGGQSGDAALMFREGLEVTERERA